MSMQDEYPIKGRGYRACPALDNNNIPVEALKGPPPNILGVNAGDLTHGTIRGNLGGMLGGIPEGTKKQIGMGGQ